MYWDPLVEYSKKLIAAPTLCQWSTYYSVLTWEKIKFCRHIAQFNMHEVSITQDLLFQFWLLAANSPFPVQLYQSTDEKNHGNDLEIAVQTIHGYVLLPCQAKMINPRDRYPSITHRVKGFDQIDLLLAYARKVAGLPIYLFYNFSKDFRFYEALEKKHGLSLEELGCSLYPAELIKRDYYDALIKKWQIPTFRKLHDALSIPLSRMICSAGKNHDVLLTSLGMPNEQPKFYSEQELTDRNFWSDLAPMPSIGRIEVPAQRSLTKQATAEDAPSFRPRFRILFPSVKRKAAIVRSN